MTNRLYHPFLFGTKALTSNPIYLIKYLNAKIYDKSNGDDFFYAISNLHEFFDSGIVQDLLKGKINKHIQPKDIDYSKMFEIFKKAIENGKQIDKSQIKELLIDLLNDKYSDHIVVIKKINYLNNFDVYIAISDIIGKDYFIDLEKPVANLAQKILQYNSWDTELETFTETSQGIVLDQMLYLDLLNFYIGFNSSIVHDSKFAHEINAEEITMRKDFENLIAKLISQGDYFCKDYYDQIADMIAAYLENEKLIYVSTKKQRGGQMNEMENAFFATIYKELERFRKKHDFKIELIDSEDRSIRYRVSRDEWLNEFRNDLVDISNAIYKSRRMEQRLSKYNSSETIKKNSLRTFKDDSQFDIIKKFKKFS